MTGSKRMTLSNQGKGKRVRFAKGDAKVFADKVATRVANSVVTHLMEGEESSVDDDDSDTDDSSSSGNKSSCLKNRNNKALKRRGSKKGKK